MSSLLILPNACILSFGILPTFNNLNLSEKGPKVKRLVDPKIGQFAHVLEKYKKGSKWKCLSNIVRWAESFDSFAQINVFTLRTRAFPSFPRNVAHCSSFSLHWLQDLWGLREISASIHTFTNEDQNWLLIWNLNALIHASAAYVGGRGAQK